MAEPFGADAPIAIVTDSTAGLSPGEVETHGLYVVPLQVVVANACYEEGVDEEASPAAVAAALKWAPVSTSRPSPARVLQEYQRAADAGARHVISLHMSAAMSATYESAVLAARESPVPVTVIDAQQVGRAVGFAVLRAAQAAAAGDDVASVAQQARSMAAASATLIYVDTLEYLRRGGRVGAAQALIGGALAVKPLLKLVEGKISNIDKVRTSGRALARLAELAAVECEGEGPIQIAVAHLANEDRAQKLAATLAERLADRLEDREVEVYEVGAVIGAHTGPGLIGVAIAPANG